MPIEGALLAGLMTLSVWQDVAHRRIPNRLLQVFALIALVLSLRVAGLGLSSALGAAVLAGAAFSPLYLLGQLGGGDLKLMATAGLLVGIPGVLAWCLSVALAGGLLSLYWLWYRRHLREPPGHVRHRMPYAMAIALGSAWHGLLNLS